MIDDGEECDLGKDNEREAYGLGSCTTQCRHGGYCGDGRLASSETCDDGDSASRDLGACNPECTGYYEKKRILATIGFHSTNLGGISGADAICEEEFDSGWKALLVGGSRRATITPLVADGQTDWVIAPYTHYYNWLDELIWRTDDVPLLGVRNGARLNLYAPVYDIPGNYPWSGYDSDWTTFPDSGAGSQGTCGGWTSDSSSAGWGSFADSGLLALASEPCGTMSFLICVEP